MEDVREYKAYEINLSKLDEGYLSDAIMCYANSKNEARKKLLDKVKYDGWRLKHTDDELTYLNIPVIRAEEYDKIMFEGELLPKPEVEKLIRTKERNEKLDNILNDPNVEYCYIWKGSYYKPNSCGYTSFRYEAGVYPKAKAVSEAKSVGDILLELIDIEKHNKMIQDKINDLSSRIIDSKTLNKEV